MNNYENINEGVSRLGCKGTEFWGSRQQIRAIPEEIALYLDVSQKMLRVLDQQQPVPYQPHCPRTS